MSIPIKSKSLYNKAFTHRSYLNESKQAKESNERLEYLGDAVLELVTSDILFKKFPKKKEGELTKIRSALVKTQTLAKVARELNFGDKLLMSRGEKQTGGQDNDSLLENTFEAVVGAIYLESGLEAAYSFIDAHLLPLLPEIMSKKLFQNHKSQLQEKVQARGHATPTYKVISQTGPDHDKIFTSGVFVEGRRIATGTDNSKQKSEQLAAQKALEYLDEGGKL